MEYDFERDERCDIRLRSIKVSGLDSTCARARINDRGKEGEGGI